jgi:hypothetical protein
MEVKELLYPRFKVISDYPFNLHFAVGQIITLEQSEPVSSDSPDLELLKKHGHVSTDKDQLVYFTDQPQLANVTSIVKVSTRMYEDDFKKYPTIFRQLYWYEERAIEDMPCFIMMDGKIKKVDTWRKSFTEHRPETLDEKGNNFIGIKWHFCAKQSRPCSQEEYNVFMTSNA